MKTLFLTPLQKMRIVEGIRNKESKYEGEFFNEIDRLESLIRDYEMLAKLTKEKLDENSNKKPSPTI